MRWAAIIVLAVVLVTGCRKQEEDIEALSREAVEDEVTAVLDSLEQAAATGRSDMAPVSAEVQPAVHRPPLDPAAVVTSEPAAGDSEPAPISDSEIIAPIEAPEADLVEQGQAGWVIQIGTFTEYTAAVQAADTYKLANLPAFVRRVDKDGKTFYRLRIGAYDTREEARTVGEELKVRYGLEYWIAPSQ